MHSEALDGSIPRQVTLVTYGVHRVDVAKLCGSYESTCMYHAKSC